MADENKEKLHIRLHVYDTDIPVNIVREDESLYRAAAKLISDRINAYAQIYNGRKGEKELHYMALIDIALMYERDHFRNDTVPFVNTLSKLTTEIEEAMKNKNS